MGEIIDWWVLLPDAVRAATVTGSATLVAAALGFAALFYQLGRQSKNAIRQSQKNESLKLKVQIYEKVVETTAKAQEAVGEFTAYIRAFDLQLLFASYPDEDGKPRARPPTQRYPDYSKLREEASLAVINVITMIERWHVVDRRLKIFRNAISMGLAAHRDIVFRGPDLLVHAMPMEGFVPAWSPPSPEQLAHYRARMEIELYQMERLSAWVGDFQVEMQMLLLGELFTDPVERRDPPDPEQFCIRLDQHDEIERRLEATDWARRSHELEAEAWARFSEANERDRSI